jgi:hypothetical protein
MSAAVKRPSVATIPIGRGIERMAVRVRHDGSVTLDLMIEHTTITIDLPRAAAGALIDALTPDKAVLIETLDMLRAAAEAHCPSPLTDDPEVVADARDLRDQIKAAREVLGVHASC